MNKFVILPVFVSVLLAGCKSSADRMYECEAQGISRDTCYQVEQSRKQGINDQAMAQAYRNATSADLSGNKHHSHHQPTQHAQAAKTRTVKGFGVTVKIAGDWVTLDGKPAALDETTESAKVYSQGLYQVIVYKSGKVALLKERVVQGYLK